MNKGNFLGIFSIFLGCVGIFIELISPDLIRISCIDSIGSNYSYYFIYFLILFIGIRIRRTKGTSRKNNTSTTLATHNQNLSKPALNQDWLELITNLKWLIKDSDDLELGEEDDRLELSDQFKTTFPALSKLIDSARILNLKINGTPYKVYGWTSKSENYLSITELVFLLMISDD